MAICIVTLDIMTYTVMATPTLVGSFGSKWRSKLMDDRAIEQFSHSRHLV
ncbi:MAG: hypothetical protein MUE44_33795 [Oscillatoriaceae cyanobacterium Prado104]|nr:hypothetical protein [Oscillatoriaceae cyanobacterium Prado104]